MGFYESIIIGGVGGHNLVQEARCSLGNDTGFAKERGR